ncbi:MAG: hypothetical protein K0B05_13585 [Bacteroidales bacterium]|nr:hypothetical protein [Bacteroidales bacterium]
MILRSTPPGRSISRERSQASGVRSVIAGMFILSLLFFLHPVSTSAQGNLLITPRRVVLEGSKRSFDLNLANIGQDSATYAISLVQIRMTDDGGFETITEPDPGQRFADRYIRYFPRSVTLGPNESQVVKIQLVRTNELSAGEYRSHFYFRAVPKARPLGEADTSQDTSSFSVRLTPIFGITIPVIIRSGETSVNVALTDLSLKLEENSDPGLSLLFNRTGNMSVYGDLTVDHISPQGSVTRVGIAKGVAVYTPNAVRRFQFNLNRVQGVDFRSGTLRVIYSAPSDVKPVRYAEAEIMLK